MTFCGNGGDISGRTYDVAAIGIWTAVALLGYLEATWFAIGSTVLSHRRAYRHV